MSTVQLLNIILLVIIFLIFILGMIAILLIVRMRNKKQESEQKIQTKNQVNLNNPNLITRDGKAIDSIYKFMEFDAVIDNMIARKNRTQYVMVIQCKGLNYDLLSEDEKEAVENGFTEFLNTLRFPIQLYVQTRKLDFTELLNDYEKRTSDLKDQIARIDAQIQTARNRGNQELITKLMFERKRKQNIMEYGESIEEYTARINASKNMLQQKTYLILTYYTAEIGDTAKYSKDEIDDIVFSELYTRAQTLIRALSSAEVSGKVLNSEELAELLYIAYNRDGAESYTLKNALDAQYDRLYSTAKDTLEDKQKRIAQQVEQEASKLASKSIIKADEKIRAERAKKAQQVKERATEMVNDYKNELSKPLYEETMKQINEAESEDNSQEASKRRIIRKNI